MGRGRKKGKGGGGAGGLSSRERRLGQAVFRDDDKDRHAQGTGSDLDDELADYLQNVLGGSGSETSSGSGTKEQAAEGSDGKGDDRVAAESDILIGLMKMFGARDVESNLPDYALHGGEPCTADRHDSEEDEDAIKRERRRIAEIRRCQLASGQDPLLEKTQASPSKGLEGVVVEVEGMVEEESHGGNALIPRRVVATSMELFPFVLRPRARAPLDDFGRKVSKPRQRSMAKGAQGGKLLPGEKRKLRKEKIEAKRATREACRGFDVTLTVQLLLGFLDEGVDTLSLPPCGKHGQTVSQSIARLCGCQAGIQGSGKKQCVVVRRTQRSGFPTGPKEQKLRELVAEELKAQRLGAAFGSGVGPAGMAKDTHEGRGRRGSLSQNRDRSSDPFSDDDPVPSSTRGLAPGDQSESGGSAQATRRYARPVRFVSSQLLFDPAVIEHSVTVTCQPVNSQLAPASPRDQLLPEAVDVLAEGWLSDAPQEQVAGAAERDHETAATVNKATPPPKFNLKALMKECGIELNNSEDDDDDEEEGKEDGECGGGEGTVKFKYGLEVSDESDQQELVEEDSDDDNDDSDDDDEEEEEEEDEEEETEGEESHVGLGFGGSSYQYTRASFFLSPSGVGWFKQEETNPNVSPGAPSPSLSRGCGQPSSSVHDVGGTTCTAAESQQGAAHQVSGEMDVGASCHAGLGSSEVGSSSYAGLGPTDVGASCQGRVKDKPSFRRAQGLGYQLDDGGDGDDGGEDDRERDGKEDDVPASGIDDRSRIDSCDSRAQRAKPQLSVREAALCTALLPHHDISSFSLVNSTKQQLKKAAKKAAKDERRRQSQQQQATAAAVRSANWRDHHPMAETPLFTSLPLGEAPEVGPSELGSKSQNQLALGFASFERHTNGIGSRLMASMGWKEGDGLGRARQGMAMPIAAHQRPKKLGIGAD